MRRPPMKRSRGRESRLKRDCLGQKNSAAHPGRHLGATQDETIGADRVGSSPTVPPPHGAAMISTVAVKQRNGPRRGYGAVAEGVSDGYAEV